MVGSRLSTGSNQASNCELPAGCLKKPDVACFMDVCNIATHKNQSYDVLAFGQAPRAGASMSKSVSYCHHVHVSEYDRVCIFLLSGYLV